MVSGLSLLGLEMKRVLNKISGRGEEGTVLGPAAELKSKD